MKDISTVLSEGFANHDRMSAEIRQIIQRVIHLCDDWFRNSANRGDFFDIGEEGEWRVMLGDRRTVMVIAFFPSMKVGQILHSCPLDGSKKAHFFQPAAEDVQVIHQGLSLFLSGMMEKVPKLTERLQPFLSASSR